MSQELLRRWRLLLGNEQANGMGVPLSSDDIAIDGALGALYDSARNAGLGSSAPSVPRWLGDIRKYFPKSVVQVMQRDALSRLNLTQLLTEPELFDAIKPDAQLAATLLSLHGVLPAKTKETARRVVAHVAQELMHRLQEPVRQAIAGALNRASRNRRPRHQEIDWPRTIGANLQLYQPEHQTIIPHIRIGWGRKRSSLLQVILCVDQSGSIAASAVYSSIFAAVRASLPAVKPRLVVFDTSVVDLTDELHDPVEVLFSAQLGGGADINRAVGYCQTLVERPQETTFVLNSDLYEGGVAEELLRRAGAMIASGVKFITLLALSDEGAPSFDRGLAAQVSALGAPAFACTPDMFPDLMAAAINRHDVAQWATERNILTTRAAEGSG